MSTSEPDKSSPNNVAELASALADKDAVVRKSARLALVALRTQEVTRTMVGELNDPRRHVRWEAAKALAAIADPVSAPGLMHALDDDDEDVRWVAAEGLIALGKVGLVAVLSGLTKRAGSIDFCTSAHHVLHEMKAYARFVSPVIKALEQLEPAVAAPPAAYHALVAMSDLPDTE